MLPFLVAVPSAIKVFNWTATMFRGSITYDTQMLYAFGFIGLFTIGGLTGLFLATLAVQLARGTPLLEAGIWASCAGALTVRALGPTGLDRLTALPQAVERYKLEARPPVPLTTVG